MEAAELIASHRLHSLGPKVEARLSLEHEVSVREHFEMCLSILRRGYHVERPRGSEMGSVQLRTRQGGTSISVPPNAFEELTEEQIGELHLRAHGDPPDVNDMAVLDRLWDAWRARR